MKRDLEADISAAQRASQSGIAELLSIQEAKVITRMVLEYRSGKLTPEQAKVGVAVISEFRTLVSDADRAMIRGADATTQMMTGAPR